MDFHDQLIAASQLINSNLPSSKPPTMPDRPVPQVSDVDLAHQVSQQDVIEAVIESLKVSGACIVRNMVSKEGLDEIEKDIEPHLNTAKVWQGDFYPVESRRVTGCVGKSKAFALNIVGHPVWQAVGQYFLTSRLDWNWIGAQNERSTSAPQLSNTVVFSLLPGARKQALHRDDDTHHNQPAAATHHVRGRDTGMTVFVAATRSTRANGATRFIPGSHLWDYAVPPPAETVGNNNNSSSSSGDDGVEDERHAAAGGRLLLRHAELEAGDALMMLSGVYHAAGANRTDDQERLIFSAATTRGWLRQEENQYLANEVAAIRGLPRELQRFVGYSLSRPSLGWVDFGDPIGLVGGGEGEGGEGVEDMF